MGVPRLSLLGSLKWGVAISGSPAVITAGIVIIVVMVVAVVVVVVVMVVAVVVVVVVIKRVDGLSDSG